MYSNCKLGQQFVKKREKKKTFDTMAEILICDADILKLCLENAIEQKWKNTTN